MYQEKELDTLELVREKRKGFGNIYLNTADLEKSVEEDLKLFSNGKVYYCLWSDKMCKFTTVYKKILNRKNRLEQNEDVKIIYIVHKILINKRVIELEEFKISRQDFEKLNKEERTGN